MSGLIVLLVVVPLVTAFLLSITAVPHKVTHESLMKIRNILSVCGFITLSGVLVFLAPDILSGTVYTYTLGGWETSLGVALQLDAFSFVIAVISVLVAFLGMIYSISYMEHIRGMGKYDALYFLMVTGIMGVLVTRDLFNMYVFIEILSISIYILITTGEKKENYLASLKYLILGSLSSAFFLFGVGIIYSVTGSLNMDYAAEGILTALQKDPDTMYVAFSLLFVSLGVKFSIVPLHFWLPDAHSMAPSPVSALQSGVVLKVSIYALVRLATLFGKDFFYIVSPFILYLGVVTVVVGTLLALVQHNIKRMLAYSTISQIGIIITGIGIGSSLAMTGAIFHIVNHAVMKSGLFLCAGIIIHQSGSRKISQLRMGSPGMAVSFLVLSLGIVGIPPLNGFVSKYIICYGAVQAEYSAVAFIVLGASILSAVYYFRVLQQLFGVSPWRKGRKKREKIIRGKVSRLMSYTVYALALLSVFLGVFPLIGVKAIDIALAVIGW
ncbi:MAG: proton-conducting transporter membrane subunit [Candidatus Methanofastidiosia archaeon]|jgi:multicomponent Na+:H+ antiporter subunit D